jgi:hypothetical protein
MTVERCLSEFDRLIKVSPSGQVSGDQEGARDWTLAEIRAHRVAFSELLSAVQALIQAVQEVADRRSESAPQASRIQGLLGAVARRFNDEADRLAIGHSQLWTVHKVTRHLSFSLDIGRALQRALGAVVSATSADMGAVLILERASGELTLEAGFNWSGDETPLAVLPPAWHTLTKSAVA